MLKSAYPSSGLGLGFALNLWLRARRRSMSWSAARRAWSPLARRATGACARPSAVSAPSMACGRAHRFCNCLSCT